MAITLTEDHPRIRDFLNAHGVGILATADPTGLPHAAAIYFVIDSDFAIYFITKEKTAKHRNLQQNPRAALAVCDARMQTTVQASGDVIQITDPRQIERLQANILDVTRQTSGDHKPPASKLNAGGYVAYCLRPKTLRMAEFVKAEYPPVDPLFEVVAFPEKDSLG